MRSRVSFFVILVLVMATPAFSVSYRLTASSSEGGSVSPQVITVRPGDSKTFTATPDSGYAINSWYLNGMKVREGGSTYTVSDIQADQEIYVTFRKIEITINATAGPNGSITPITIVVNPGGEAEFTALPDIGYSVDTWYLDNNLDQNGGTNFKLVDIQTSHEVYVTFRKALAYSLDEIEFEDEEEFEERIVSNNTTPAEPDKALILIDRTVGVGPEPDNVVMQMRNVRDPDPNSPSYGQIVHARAKGSFIKTDVDKVVIKFRYLFLTSNPEVKIVVYLSDSPELLDPNDSLFQQHYIKVAEILNPPFPRPGSAGTERFAVFQKPVGTGNLNFTDGLYIELELIEPDTTGLLFAGPTKRMLSDSSESSVFIDDWNPAVQCYGICLDINWDNFVDEADFLMVIGGTGYSATGENACLDGAFSNDGSVDSYDVMSWDWSLNSDMRLLNFCGVPLSSGSGNFGFMSVSGTRPQGPAMKRPAVNISDNELSDLLIAGKKNQMNPASKLKDSLYAFDAEGRFSGSFEPASDRCNIRLIKGPDGAIYQLNCEIGLLRLDGADTAVIPPGRVTLSNITDPRYNTSASVYVGIQDEGADSFGRPLLDVAFDSEYVYVVPVVVQPNGQEPYTTAAKLKLLEEATNPYEIVQLYDDPPLTNDNQYRDYLREIEIDDDGNLYVLNVHALNESDILWRYKPDGTIERIDLGRPDGDIYIPAPVGMCMSKTTDMLYLTSALYNPKDPDLTVLYGLSTTDAITLERTITIEGMQHITDITEDPQTGTLWAAGYNMYDIPVYPNPFLMAFYYPCIAKMPLGGDSAEVIHLYNIDSHDLALPMSILWTGSAGFNQE